MARTVQAIMEGRFIKGVEELNDLIVKSEPRKVAGKLAYTITTE